MLTPKVLFIEGCDFETFPAGGQLAMARSLIKYFGSDLALVGMDRGDTPVGEWTTKEINGTSYRFFAVCHRKVSGKRPLIPARLTFYLGLQRYRKNILSIGCRDALIQAPESLLAVAGWNLRHICYMFAGVENSLKISRYRLARAAWPLFDRLVFSALDRVEVILASADEDAIRGLVARSKGTLPLERISQLPTCVDLSEFRPAPVHQARPRLDIPRDRTVFVTTGRIGRFKGWELLLDSFAKVRREIPESLLIFVGDGEDRPLVEESIAARGLGSSVRITGFQTPANVCRYLNAADAVVFGSLVEGWSVSMLEALACGKAIVSTKVSGVKDMIVPGENGFVVSSRDPGEFAQAMRAALGLPDAQTVSRAIAGRYSLARVGMRLGELWPPLRSADREPPSVEQIGQLQASWRAGQPAR